MTTDDREVLLIIDVQNDFCPGGALAVPEGDAIVPAINRLAHSFAHVILTQDWHPPGHTSFASSHPGKRGFRRITLCGLATDFCVAFSAIDGRGAGFEVAVVTSACRGIDNNGSLDRALRSMVDAGVRVHAE